MRKINSPPDSEDPRAQSILDTFHEHRGLLFSIAYRMLGSSADAEDMVQETFIRWQQTSGVDIRSARAFLVTIISRLCINHLHSARVQREEYFGEWLPEPLVTSLMDTDSPELSRIDGSLSMAFLVLLERLNPVERAVFLLREVFDYEYSEIAEILGQSEANCRQILGRARQRVAEMRPRFDPSPQQRERLLHQFLKATSDGNLEGLVALLSSEVVLHSDGGGKAPVDPQKQKLMLGPCRGGAVRLAAPGHMLMVGEGIETCLAAIQATSHPAWAALSTSGLRALELPIDVREVIVLADGDDPGEAAARDAALRWSCEGRRVRIARPPRGFDFNDVLLGRTTPIVGGRHVAA